MKLKIPAAMVTFCLIVAFNTQPGQACTAFYLNDATRQIFGANFDWSMGHGYLIVNKRQVKKTAMPGYGGDPGSLAAWTSRYGSLTFNQYGREMPMGGMNEAGLVVHMLMLRSTRYPPPDSRPAIKDLQWIQYQLDNFSRVDQVLAGSRQIRIVIEAPGLHYLVADPSGDCAVIEFIDGKMVGYTGKTLRATVLANSTYKDSVKHLIKHQGFGFEWPIPSGSDSLSRFVRTAHLLQQYDPGQQPDAVAYGFEVLTSVRQKNTQWSIIYDMPRRSVQFRTFSNLKPRLVDLQSFNFDCGDPVRVLAIAANLSGNVDRHFSTYTPLVNRDMIKKAFKGTYFFEFMPHAVVEKRVRYPESTTCVE